MSQVKHNIVSLIILSCDLVLIFIAYHKFNPNNNFLASFPYFVGITSIAVLFFARYNGYLLVYFLAGIFIIKLLINRIALTGLVKKILLPYAIVLILWITFEFVLAQTHPLEALKWGEYPALQLHSTRIYGLKPNRITRLKYNNYDYILKTNSYGLASPEIDRAEKDSLTRRILLIGDAFTMPEGVDFPKGYPGLLEQKLNRLYPEKKIEIINGGVTGYGPLEEYPQMIELGKQFQPNVIIYQFFVNDFEDVNVDPESLLISIGLKEDSTMNIVKKTILSSQVITHMVHANNYVDQFIRPRINDWRYSKSLLYFYETKNNKIFTTETLTKISDYLSKMSGYADQIGAKFLICYVPGAISVSDKKDMNYFPRQLNLKDNPDFDLRMPFRELNKICDSLQIKLVDLTPKLKSWPVQPVYFPGSWHWNESGHEAVADTLSTYIFNNKIVQ